MTRARVCVRASALVSVLSVTRDAPQLLTPIPLDVAAPQALLPA